MDQSSQSEDQLAAELKAAHARIADLERHAAERDERFRTLFDTMTEGFALHEIICDETGTPCDYRFLEVNPAFERLTGLKPGDVVGKTAREVLPRIDSSWIETFGAVALTGRPTRFENYATTLKRHYEVYAYCPAPGQFSVLFTDITERRKSEESLRESERRLEYHLENSPLAAIEWDADFVVTRWSSGAERILGWKAEETIGKRIDALNIIYEEDIPIVNSALNRLVSGEEHTLISNNRNLTKSGKVIDCIWYNSILSDDKGKMQSVLSLSQDITEHKRAERGLRDTLRRFELLAHAADSLLRSADPQKVVEEICTKVMEHLDCHICFNFLTNEEKGKLRLNVCQGISPEEARRIEWLDYGVAVCGYVAQEGTRVVAEHIPIIPDERTELVKSYGIKAYACHPLLEPGGKVVGTLSFGTKSRGAFSEDDISLMKAVSDLVAVAMIRIRNEETLRRSEQSLAAAQRIGHMGNWEWNIQTGEVRWSEELYRIRGCDPQTTVPSVKLVVDQTHPDDRQVVRAAIRQMVSDGKPFSFDFRTFRPDGSTRILHSQGEVAGFDESGKPIRAVGTIQDITERKLVEEALEKAKDAAEDEKRRLESVMEALPVGVAIIDERGGNPRSNRTFEEIWGGTRHGVRPPTRTFGDYAAYQAWWPDTCKTVQPEEWGAARAVQKGETVIGQYMEIRRFDGTRGFVINSAAPILDSSGKIAGAAVAIQDITELRSIQDALRESEERYRELAKSLKKTVREQVKHLRDVESLAAIGRLMAIVAHEIRNPLLNIQLGLDALRGRLSLDEADMEVLGEIQHGVSLVDDTINELLEYARPLRLEYVSQPIAEIVQQALEALAPTLDNIAIDVKLESDKREISVDGPKITRVLMNVLANAAEAMPEGGTLKILSKSSGPRKLSLSISDTGHGMSAETLNNLFQPFYTTKVTGTGLGLANAKKAIEAHHGSISVKSKPNRGTTVKIILPISQRQ